MRLDVPTIMKDEVACRPSGYFGFDLKIMRCLIQHCLTSEAIFRCNLSDAERNINKFLTFKICDELQSSLAYEQEMFERSSHRLHSSFQHGLFHPKIRQHTPNNLQGEDKPFAMGKINPL